MGNLEIIAKVHDLGHLINKSNQSKLYMHNKELLEKDEEVKSILNKFQVIKEKYEEAQRFGIFHPNYHEAREEAIRYQDYILDNQTIKAFKKAEDSLDELLYSAINTIAGSISEQIKIPSNTIKDSKKKRKCGG